MSTISQRAFSAGELDPALHARTDFDKYYTGAKKIKNFIVKQQGGIENRPGTEFVGEVKTSSLSTRVIPFDAGTNARYAIEFGNLYVRFIKDGSYIKLTAQAITAVTAASPAVATYTGADSLSAGDHVYLSTFAGGFGNYVNGRTLRVGTVDTGANTFQLLNLDGTNFSTVGQTAYSSGGQFEEIYTVTTTYATADLFDLQFSQSVDVMPIVHPSYVVRTLYRASDTNWTISDYSLVPTQVGPVAISVVKTGAAGTEKYYYKATAVSAATGEESASVYIGGITNGVTPLTSANYITISYTSNPNAAYYNIYKSSSLDGIYGFMAATTNTVFDDVGYTADITNPAPDSTASSPFGSSGNYPSCVSYSQQRLVFGNTTNNKESVWASKVGLYSNFETRTPGQDSDSILFKAANRKFNPIRHILDLSKMVLLTENSEIVVNADGSALSPSNIVITTQSYNGSAKLPPIVINENALYVQKNQYTVRDLLFDYQVDGFSGNDISIFAKHLFEGYTIVDWCYQKNPNSIVWAVRSDGKVLSLSYLREQNVLAWTQHDFENGFVESCCSIPTDTDDDVYFVIKRTIGGATKRYVEKLSSRFFSETTSKTVTVASVSTLRTYNGVVDVKIMDSNLSYDGRATTTTVTITSGTGWTTEDTVNVLRSAGSFVSTDVGNQVHVYTSDGDTVKLSITAYVNSTNVTCQPLNQDVPVELQSVATTDWGFAVDQLNGLWHLEGEDVSVFADGYVKHSPNNSDYTTKTVTSGEITLDDCYVVIHVGLPITAELQTLNIDTVQGETLIDKKINIQKVTMFLNKTRGLFVGQDEDGDLQEIKMRDTEHYDSPVSLKNGPADVSIESEWNSTGSVFVQQVDPLPANILSINVSGYIPTRG